MASKGIGLKQTKGNFQLKGVIMGTQKDSFYKEMVAKNGKPFRMLNFGVQVSKDAVIFVSLSGGEQEFVYFSGKPKGASKEDKSETVKVEWKNRNSYSKDGFRLIGVMCGLEKTVDEKGKEINDKRVLHPFDACDYISDKLQDGMSVFIKGTIDYSHFKSQNGEMAHSVKFIPNQISLCQPVNLEDEKLEVVSNFTQDLVFLGIEQNPEEQNFILESNIVNYNGIETATFLVEDKTLAQNFRKKLKPYTSINTWGDIRSVKNTEEVSSDDSDGWGSSNKMTKVFSPYRIVRVVTGAKPDSIDTETYSEKAMSKVLEEMQKEEAKEKAFESVEGGEWGSSKEVTDDELPWD